MMNVEKLQIRSTPYTYILEWTKQGKRYIGARWAVGCHPSDLWNSYFTSSAYVADFVKIHGAPDIILIDKTFDNAMDAMTREKELQRKFDIIKNPNFLNKGIGGVWDHRDPEVRNKLRIANIGKKIPEGVKAKIAETRRKHGPYITSDETKERLSASLMGHVTSEETKRKISLARMGQKSSRKGAVLTPETKEKIRIANLGKKHSKESKKKMSDARKGLKFSEERKQKMRILHGPQKNPCLIPRKLPKVSCPHCTRTGIAVNMKRWHFNNCKKLKGEGK